MAALDVRQLPFSVHHILTDKNIILLLAGRPVKMADVAPKVNNIG